MVRIIYFVFLSIFILLLLFFLEISGSGELRNFAATLRRISPRAFDFVRSWLVDDPSAVPETKPVKETKPKVKRSRSKMAPKSQEAEVVSSVGIKQVFNVCLPVGCLSVQDIFHSFCLLSYQCSYPCLSF